MNARIVLILAAVAAVAGGPAPDKKDLDKLQGTWQMQSGTNEGKEVSADEAAKVKITFEGNKATLKDRNSTLKATVELDQTAKPATIDFNIEKDKETIKGIYSLEGDNLKLCIALPGTDRPKEFASKAGSGETRLLVLKREKK
jgi:uncharacterized protein (TIGR03067 family)